MTHSRGIVVQADSRLRCDGKYFKLSDAIREFYITKYGMIRRDSLKRLMCEMKQEGTSAINPVWHAKNSS